MPSQVSGPEQRYIQQSVINSSMLDLQAATTLSANDQVTGQDPVSLWKMLNFNGNVLTLGSASTHLKVNDNLTLAGIALETGAGSLTLSGALTLTDNASLNSSGGTITLKSGGTSTGSVVSLPGTTLVLENPLSLTGATLKTNGTTFTTNANALSLSNSSILEVEGTQNLSGVVPDGTSTLRLTADASINDSAALSVGTLDLADFALTLNDQMAGLSIAQPVTLDAAGEKILTGAADLSLNGGISATAGTLSSTGGTLSLPGRCNISYWCRSRHRQCNN